MKQYNKFFLSFLLVLFFITSCNTKFDKTKWNDQIDPAFPSSSRSQMLKDLTTNHKLVGLNYRQLKEYLGNPDYKDSVSVSYKIIVDYGSDIDPIYTKNLEFNYSRDSTITSFKIVEWKK